MKFAVSSSLMSALILLASDGLAVNNEAAGDLAAQDIITRMQRAYANSRSYRDSGVVSIVFTGNVNQLVEKPFKTAFIRPDRFRYEFREKVSFGRDQSFVIYLNGEDLQTYWDVQKDLKHESLDQAVASATGVSQGSAITVPAMLLPDQISWRRSIRFSNPQRIDDETVAGVDCYRLQDLVLNSIPTTLWIDKKTFMLRKIYREQEFEDFRTQETTTYKPVLNGDVPKGLLEFKA